MTGTGGAPLLGGVDLLERAVRYAMGGLDLVTPATLAWPTPCPDWDVRALLHHLEDSLAALAEAADLGQVALTPARRERPAADLVGSLRQHAARLVRSWRRRDGPDLVAVAGCPVTATLVLVTGAVEVAVHGWDLAVACDGDHPLPESLARELLALVPLFVTPADRPHRFGPVTREGPDAGAGEFLLAYLGRDPAWRGRSRWSA
ncbi:MULTISPECIES: TIGR03086 family metal-binding protein [unclassified Crossiella]|uniref:TIGR03086 family metal-binding protein n=1 Tax=unclassified Crossiella TaxID=2620835 RepID=UPI00200021A7|nr:MULTISPECIES: TIGR03086 family metal-binding protein [unclassified Crossiella]MCK2239416.1 TIGR03086 family metal-binding protein [Crossiella sp. S99.2]MCK2252111.1 TIGR03086 family metal-binding protein [Crossiella sp. S99.1]